MSIKIIVTDLDNTLLRRNKTVSDYTQTILARCQERGILFAHATSRSIAASQQFADITHPDIRITCGGALATSADTELYKAAFTQNETTFLLRSLGAEPSVRQITMMSETS
jgi:hydroxymethylpyrimidine pyrophosphatase-like HAD family hydrolase